MVRNIDKSLIKSWAYEIGFDLVGIAPAEPSEHGEYLRKYLKCGRHGQMQYLARNVEKRLDPRLLMPGARSIICAAINYFNYLPRKVSDSIQSGRVARYAWFRDYHDIVKDKLKRLAEKIQSVADKPVKLQCCVDTSPVMEKSHAARAGLGWIGKNSLLINERFGSWLLLGEIVTDLQLDYDEPAAPRCGSCTNCLEACPANSLVEPYVLDARGCISYLTVESNEMVDDSLATKMNGRIFGCDICQEVCPFNQNTTVAKIPEFKPQAQWCSLNLAEILALSPEQYEQRFFGSSIARCRREHLVEIARKFLKLHKNPEP